MRNFAELLMVIGAALSIFVGFRNRKISDVGVGCCFMGLSVFGHLARSNKLYLWVEIGFSIGLSLFIVAKFLQKRRSA